MPPDALFDGQELLLYLLFFHLQTNIARFNHLP
jgi:hypothetical protein